MERVSVWNKPPPPELASMNVVGPSHPSTAFVPGHIDPNNVFIFTPPRPIFSNSGFLSALSSFPQEKVHWYCLHSLCPCSSAKGMSLYKSLAIFIVGFPKRQLKHFIKKAGIVFSTMSSSDRNNCKADDEWDSSEEVESDEGGDDIRV
jgi:hypothetical protein